VLRPSHWLNEISPPKKVYHHFWPAKVIGWWDGQHNGNQGKLKNIPL